MNLTPQPEEKSFEDSIKLRDLLESLCHIGHTTSSWNPKVASYIYGIQNGVHIINVIKTLFLLKTALAHIKKSVGNYKKILFVGTKEQVCDLVEEEATRCGQYFVTNRWLGGTLTNWSTISLSIRKMQRIRRMLDKDNEESQDIANYKKKERVKLQKTHDKLMRNLRGVEKMNGLPHLMIVFDVNKDRIAVREANRMKIPVVGIIDSNSDPEGVKFPIPGNDDAIRSVSFFAKKFSEAAILGMKDAVSASMERKKDGQSESSKRDSKKNTVRRFVRKENRE